MDVRRVLALALAVPLLLAGCTEGEPEPKMPDSPPTSSEPSPSPAEMETAEPEVESAEEFIRRWVAAGDEMQVTGGTAEYDAMSPKCQACQSFIQNVAEIYEGGGSIEFAGTVIENIDRVGKQPPTFDVAESVAETVIREDGGPRTLPPGETTIRVTLGKVSDSWVVTHFGVV